ncbi:MAG TPA: hypothetical protein VMW52_13785 [Phycisphaerae bacterium]|nr:hypothetical protein [Phycisphaerae bacterium]
MTPDERKQLIHELREFARAYPESIFTPFTPAEIEKHGTIITRASAAAGRHFAEWFIKAADALDQIDADEQRRKDDETLMGQALEALEECRRWAGSFDFTDSLIRALRARLDPPAVKEPPHDA